jgi:uncharacterized protein YyaL (SSP411 family)
MSRNALADETSPYLLQHKDNPVHWQPWGHAAFATAKAEDKPVLLSVGYAACHWCHVMAQESFSDPEIAALMNELFVSIKVDREERPDIDTIYQHALALQGEQGGWPLTMFLTPEGEPFWGGTYFPPTGRWGRPSFPDVLRAIAQAYRGERDKVAQSGAQLRNALARLSQPAGGAGLTLGTADQIAEHLVRQVDRINGGLGAAPKFPETGVFEFLWRAGKRTRNAAMREAVIVTLDHICQGGIYDHVGGGFARYSVDERWLVPHFEKMLYDNALLIDLLTGAWQETRNPLYAQRIAETVEWIGREMVMPDGGFASSLDADSEHEEGKFYVWSEAEIDQLLGERAPRFKEFYDVTPGGNWEGRTILNRLKHMDLAAGAVEAELAACRAVLFHARAERVPPTLDDKVLADWNGLMIAALANAAVAHERPDWLDLASEAFAFISGTLAEENGRLHHSWRDGRARHAAVLDDYANMSRAALALFTATGEPSYLDRAKQWVEIVDRHYWDGTGGGYFLTADDAEALIVRVKRANDAPMPSGNGTLVGVLARLYYLTGEARYRDRAEAVVAAFAGEAQRTVGYSALLNGNELLQRGLQVVVVGKRGEDDAEALRRVAYGLSLPNLVLEMVDPAGALPAGHPAAGKGQKDGRATAYVCEGATCSLPMTEPGALGDELARRG